jgi:hypothetical protein
MGKYNNRNEKQLSGASGVLTFPANAPAKTCRENGKSGARKSVAIMENPNARGKVNPSVASGVATRPCPACGVPMTRGYAALRKTDRVTRKSWTYNAEVWACENSGCGAGSYIGFPVDDVTGLLKLELKRRGGAPRGATMAEEKRTGGWGGAYAACVECGTTARRHRGRGLCSSCYQRAARKAKRERRAAAASIAPAPAGGPKEKDRGAESSAAPAIGNAPPAATAIAGEPAVEAPGQSVPASATVDVVVRFPGEVYDVLASAASLMETTPAAIVAEMVARRCGAARAASS